jgi:hypothetical protein
MKSIIVLFALVFAALPVSGQQPAAQKQPNPPVTETAAWAEFTSREGKFSIALPGAPQKQEQAAQTPLGPMQLHLFMIASSNGVYLAGYADADFLAAASNDAKTISSILAGTVAGLASSLKGTVLEEGELQTERYTGRQARLQLPGELSANLRIFLLNGRIYQLILIHQQGKTGAPEFKQFFPSFRVLP